VRHLIIHCSDSLWGDAEEVRRWHTLPPPRGNGWSDIGYHYVIQGPYPTYRALQAGKPVEDSDGLVVPGRPENVAGAHAKGFNASSLGVCLVGRGPYTLRQLSALHGLCLRLMERYGIPVANVLGHCETPLAAGKTCPNLDMAALRRTLAELQAPPSAPRPRCARGP
jgi:N-acetylmuramoyl-L-alanine amidase